MTLSRCQCVDSFLDLNEVDLFCYLLCGFLRTSDSIFLVPVTC